MKVHYLFLFFLWVCISNSAVCYGEEAPSLSFFDANNKDAPVYIKADWLEYNEKIQELSAHGSVEIQQEHTILRAAFIEYHLKENKVYAKGNVRLFTPDGNSYYGENVELQENLKEGVIDHFSARLSDDSLIIANQATREEEGDIFRLKDMAYSPCHVCKASPIPVWQLKARDAKLSQKDQEVTYRDAFFELYGVPILYTPYFVHPTPNADNKTGFLIPSYRNSSTLGSAISLPFYYTIHSAMDFTFIPTITEKESPIFAGKFRHLTHYGQYVINASATHARKRDNDGNLINGKDVRGHVEGKGNFQLKNGMNVGFAGMQVSDDTYLRRYDIYSDTVITNKIFAEKIDNRDYFEATMLSFRDLSPNKLPSTQPWVHPMIEMHHEKELSKGRMIVDGNFFSFSRSFLVEGKKDRFLENRASLDVAWNVPYTTKNGHAFTFETGMRGDIYYLNTNRDRGKNFSENSYSTKKPSFVIRAIPEIIGKWRYPLARVNGNYTTIIEPIVILAYTSPVDKSNIIPNEDSQELEISDITIFGTNRYTGLDRYEKGGRANYGMRASIHHVSGYNVDMLLGQNYHRKPEKMTHINNLNTHLSDYIGRVTLQTPSTWNFSYRFDVDRITGNIRKNEIDVGAQSGPLLVNVGYVKYPSNPHFYTKRREIFVAPQFQITPQWGIKGEVRRNLIVKKGSMVSGGSSLIYTGDCVNWNFLYKRNFVKDRDIVPESTYTLQLSLKNLTQFSLNGETSLFQQRLPSDSTKKIND